MRGRKGADTEIMIYTGTYQTPLGNCLLAADEKSLAGLWFEGQKYYASIDGETEVKEDNAILTNVKRWLDAYFAGERPEISEIPLAPQGGEFRQEVWKILCEIPYGEVMTYGEIAKIIAKKKGKESMSAQAVGGAVAHNPISVIIPCHRVIGSNHSLTGYAGGIEKKRWLLIHEGYLSE